MSEGLFLTCGVCVGHHFCLYVFRSPAPMDIKRPRLTCPEDELENIIVAETPSPKPKNPESKNELKSIAEE